MKEQKDACNQILEAMDNEYKVCAGKLDEEIRKLERENQGFRQRLESAQHHASQSEHKANQERKKIEEATRVISTLEHRLSKFEAPAGQEIQKRTVTNRGSVMSELEDARVKLVQKEGEIRRLTERLDQLRRDPTTNGPRPDESPESWASRKVSECMDALKKEKKKRDDERHQFERDKATHFSEIKRLKEQAEKLRIENSRLQAACPGRPKGSIFMQKPRN
ncbi:hypothetical protein BJX61DRAFT_510959 [Aspergillus egyptiacus]|nr:hypothetical protein BJX61DRAFT_510959 [Aspergillus egyptiacus]